MDVYLWTNPLTRQELKAQLEDDHKKHSVALTNWIRGHQWN